mmetsp:Transcript_1403/g.2447  ORF Transcript_1403/g.2447 Transcript_1403/m.2447 type:complete len:228 (+) Transcript_1403:759-1442(+)
MGISTAAALHPPSISGCTCPAVCPWIVSDLHAMHFVRHIDYTLVDLRQNGFSGVIKGLFDVEGRLGRRFQKHEPVFSCKLLALIFADRSSGIQVGLIPYEHDGDVRVCVLACILEPRRQALEGLPPCDVVHEQRTGGAAIVRPCDGAKGLLSRGVPNLQLDGLGVDLHHFRPEFHANGQIVHGLETSVRELQQETALSHAHVTYDNILEKISVRHSGRKVIRITRIR